MWGETEKESRVSFLDEKRPWFLPQTPVRSVGVDLFLFRFRTVATN